jgi:hypothetical protein
MCEEVARGVRVSGRRNLDDHIATCVSRLIVYAAEEVVSLGRHTAGVEQVATLIASWAAKIARWLKALLDSLRHLMPIIRQLGEIIEELKRILIKLRGRRPEDPRRARARRHDRACGSFLMSVAVDRLRS